MGLDRTNMISANDIVEADQYVVIYDDKKTKHINSILSSSSNSMYSVDRQDNCVKWQQSEQINEDEEPLPPRVYKPCVVCGDKSNGYHFGVPSCEGCKGFFRRSVLRDTEFKCENNETCTIDRTTRNKCQFCRFKKCFDRGMSKEAVKGDRKKKQELELKQALLLTISKEDIELVELCTKLAEQTTDFSSLINSEIESSEPDEYKLTCDEFLQIGIRKCIKFCLNLPGNSEICTDDRAKLLKYGAYEIALLRLAARYEARTDTLMLSNNTAISEAELCSNEAFGLYGETFFEFCRMFSRFQLEESQFALLCALKFFATDRPHLIERNKISEIQSKYIYLFEYLTKKYSKHKKSKTVCLSQILLSLIKLRALDVLTAESMFKIVNKNEEMLMSNSVDGYITEVLHREMFNITSEIAIGFR